MTAVGFTDQTDCEWMIDVHLDMSVYPVGMLF